MEPAKTWGLGEPWKPAGTRGPEQSAEPGDLVEHDPH